MGLALRKALAQLTTAVAQRQVRTSFLWCWFASPDSSSCQRGESQKQYNHFSPEELHETCVLAVRCCSISFPGHGWDHVRRTSPCDPEASYEMETLQVCPASAAFCSRGLKWHRQDLQGAWLSRGSSMLHRAVHSHWSLSLSRLERVRRPFTHQGECPSSLLPFVAQGGALILPCPHLPLVPLRASVVW